MVLRVDVRDVVAVSANGSVRNAVGREQTVVALAAEQLVVPPETDEAVTAAASVQEVVSGVSRKDVV